MKQLLDKRLRGQDLTILVWGTGTSNVDDINYKKRKKIKDELAAHFPVADVRFSEELGDTVESIIPGATAEWTIQQQELVHLFACDLCVVLDTSKGSGEEIAHFVQTNQARKLLILTHERFKDAESFPAELRRNENQVFYTEDEFKSCNLVERVKTRAIILAAELMARAG
ncbi:MAG: hypothetical protein IID44_28580 [Planctomycetes bacterium]|nr:hypothetical protein [Planctomycetota bacterium]